MTSISTTLPEADTASGDAASSFDVAQNLDVLDGMRFIAIALIVFDHMNGLFKVPSIPGIDLLGIVVSYFLVLSGFVLAHQYPQFPNVASWLRYLGARLARLGPLALTGLAMICVANPYPTFDRDAVLPSFIANLLQLQAWIPDRNYYLCYNAPAWTLSAEVLLYLLLPVCLLAARRKWLFLVFSVVVSFTTALLAYHLSPDELNWASWKFPPTRIMDFAAGIVIYKLLQARKKRLSLAKSLLLEANPLFCIMGIFIPLIQMGAGQLQQGTSEFAGIFIFGRILPAAMFAALIYALVAGRGLLRLVANSRMFKFMGSISAALYFIHFSIKVHYDIITQNVPITHSFRLYALTALLMLSSSYVVSRCIEFPLRWRINYAFDRIFEHYFPGKTVTRWHGKSSLRTTSITSLAAIALSAGLYCYIEHAVERDKAKAAHVQH